MSKEEKWEITIIYDINKKDKQYEKNEGTINIFGKEFIENNKNICKMIIDNKEYEISEKYDIVNFNNNILEIKLKGINNITNMNYMFCGCSSLSSLPDISKWNINNVTNMSSMFSECSSLSSIPDISKWNTNNVTNMFDTFNGCKYNINVVTAMTYSFTECKSLSSLPDISECNTNNAKDMS